MSEYLERSIRENKDIYSEVKLLASNKVWALDIFLNDVVLYLIHDIQL